MAAEVGARRDRLGGGEGVLEQPVQGRRGPTGVGGVSEGLTDLTDHLGFPDDHRVQAARDREEVLDRTLAGVDVKGLDDGVRVRERGGVQGGDDRFDAGMERRRLQIGLESVAGRHDDNPGDGLGRGDRGRDVWGM